ncbi:MAG: hexitol phosphatase HxpB, partial [Myxococcota bacterium]
LIGDDSVNTETTGARALIFDLDGVLIDSEPLWQRAQIECFAEVGVHLNVTDCLQTQGQRIDEAVAFWFERTPWAGPSCEIVAETIIDRMDTLIREEGKPMPAVMDCLDWAAASDWRLALASSSPKRLIRCVLDRFDIGDRFEVVRSAQDEAFGKPHPDVYRSASRELRLDPGACVAIEDSAHGVAAALAAGMCCVAVPPPEARHDRRFSKATICLSSLSKLPEALKNI